MDLDLEKMRPIAVAQNVCAAPEHHLVARQHPVAKIQANVAQERMTQYQLLGRTYGTALPLQIMTEEKILGQMRRLPALNSSHLGLHIIRNEDEKFGFEDYLSDPRYSEFMVDVHKATEEVLGMNKPL
eukprot:c5270_g1_i1.p1 GENE.c5270_g1_i1~~c5270_g1_i1.p1  ORF type:complete len:136 (+),score=29.18 c5270_g1_i1:26-409(+)